MQIHELETFISTPSDSTFLAIDDGTETNKIPATDLGISTAMTQAEAEAGTSTSKRVITPAVFKSAVLAIAKTISDTWIAKDTVHVTSQGTSGDWTYRKWSDGTAEAWLKYTEPTAQAFTASGNFYYRGIQGIYFPSGLFATAPIVQATMQMGNVGSCEMQSINTIACSITVLSAVATARAVTVNLYAIGRWK